jgi:hypothetical protein
MMTDDELKQLADAAELSDCLYEHIPGAARYEETWDAVVRFAALVRAEEREECARIAQQTVCAIHVGSGIRIYGAPAAKAIRARGKESK